MPTVAELRGLRPALERAGSRTRWAPSELVSTFDFPGHGAAVHVPLAPARGGLPDRVGQRRHHGGRLRGAGLHAAHRGVPRRALERAARHAGRRSARPLRRRSACPLHPQLRPAVARWPRRPRARLGSGRPAATRSSRSSSVPSSWSTRPTRPCGSSTAGVTARCRRSRCRPGPGRASAPPRHRGGCSTTATSSPRTAPSWTPRSSRRPRRTSRASRRTCATLVERWVDLDDHDLSHRCEQAIRNYDPCISCATHFLDLTVDRT